MTQVKLFQNEPFIVGDVVTHQDRAGLMTVEGVRSTRFGMTLDCCWFDHMDGLIYGTFPSNQLDVFPRPASERSVVVGTEVRLRSRGPVMTVVSLKTKNGELFANCSWTGPMKRERQRLFPVSGLALTLFERFGD